MQQYFVGFDAEHVVIFQGVRGDVLGLPLHRVTERSDIAATDLPETERSQVSDGIYASDGLDDARRLVTRLRALMLAPCPTTPAPAVVAPAPVPDPAVAPPGAPVDPALPPPVDTTPVPTVPPEPGTTCRPVG
jgi:protein phosphatase